MQRIDADYIKAKLKSLHINVDASDSRWAIGYNAGLDRAIEAVGYASPVGIVKTSAKNISECNPVDEFICSNCGLVMRDLQRIEIDEDTGDESCYEFKFSYCPRCGYEIVTDEVDKDEVS